MRRNAVRQFRTIVAWFDQLPDSYLRSVDLAVLDRLVRTYPDHAETLLRLHRRHNTDRT